MPSRAFKLMACVIGLAFVLAAAVPADAAKARKHKKKIIAPAASVTANSGYRGSNLFRAGPIYNGYDYIGDDPDPFIRLMLQRDMGARYGGEP